VTTRPTELATHTLDVPGAALAYDVRGNDASTEPVLLLIGSPMGAAGFGTLAQHFSDRTVVTYDPRGVERSTKTDPASPVTPEVDADDLHRLIQELGRAQRPTAGQGQQLRRMTLHPGGDLAR
jgi:pimeloyl-ACP methyl ester carboxylesterase